jgi:hypothetical protein
MKAFTAFWICLLTHSDRKFQISKTRLSNFKKKFRVSQVTGNEHIVFFGLRRFLNGPTLFLNFCDYLCFPRMICAEFD